MNWVSWVTLGIAILGAGLGIFNTWHGWRQSKVPIRVTPTKVELDNFVGQDAAGGAIYGRFLSPAVAIINLSSFPVTVEEVGYEVDGGEKHMLSRIDAPARLAAGGQFWISDRLPQRLESRSALRMAWAKED